MAIGFSRVAPVLPVRDVVRSLAHYERLGFVAETYRGSEVDAPIYGFLSRGAVQLHVARVEGLDPKANTSACYVYVEDASALHSEWEAANAGGRLTAPADTSYGLREFAHVDEDGNLLRIGSPITPGR